MSKNIKTKCEIQFPLDFKQNIGFLGCNLLTQKSQKTQTPKPNIAVIGLPFDNAVTNRRGAKSAPNAIRKASLMLCDAYYPTDSNSPIKSYIKNISPILPNCKIVDLGDLKIPNKIFKMQKCVSEHFAKTITKYHLCTLGGDHSLTLPILQAHFNLHKKPLALIHFDAHCDTWTEHHGGDSGHGTWVYEAHKQGLIDIKKCVQIGIRSAGEDKYINFVRNHGGAIYSARGLRGIEGKALQPIINDIKKQIGKSAVYLSFDIDALDPSTAPGTGTPEPAGLTITQALTFLEGLSTLNFVGMDCMEVCPKYDHAEITSLSAAHLVWAYVCGQLSGQLAKTK